MKKTSIILLCMFYWMINHVVMASMRKFTQPIGQRVVVENAQRFMSMDQARKLLNVPINATPKQIKKNFRTATLKAHPDAGGTDQDMKALNEAYGILSGKIPATPVSATNNGFYQSHYEETSNHYQENSNSLFAELCRAMRDNNITQMQNILKKGIDVNSSGSYEKYESNIKNADSFDFGIEKNMTPLMIAVLLNNAEMVKILLEAGANPNATRITNYYNIQTVLQLAIMYDDVAIIKLLLEHGAKPTSDDLVFALSKEGPRFGEIFAMLLAIDPLVKINVDWNYILINEPMRDQNGIFLDALLKAGYKIPKKYLKKHSRMTGHSPFKDEAGVEYYMPYLAPANIPVLIKHGVQFGPEVLDKYTKYRDYAFKSGILWKKHFLTQLDEAVVALQKQQQKPLQISPKDSNVKQRTNINNQAINWNQELCKAIEEDDDDQVMKAIDAGADVNAKLRPGYSILMEALVVGASPDIIEALLKAGADVNYSEIVKSDVFGQSFTSEYNVFEYAAKATDEYSTRSQEEEIFKLLLKYGLKIHEQDIVNAVREIFVKNPVRLFNLLLSANKNLNFSNDQWRKILNTPYREDNILALLELGYQIPANFVSEKAKYESMANLKKQLEHIEQASLVKSRSVDYERSNQK